MKQARVTVLLAALTLALVSTTGCSVIADKIAEKATEKVVEGATGADIDIDGDNVTIEGEDGAQTAVGEDVAVPKDFPSDVPVYDGTVRGAFANEDSWVLNIETKDSADDVLAFYQKKLEGSGWVKETVLDTEDGGMYSAKKDSRQVAIVVTKGEDGADAMTSIAVSVGNQ